MKMDDYLDEIEFAATKLLDAIWHESAELTQLQLEVDALQRHVTREYQRADLIAQDALDADDVMLATAIHWDTYFGAGKELRGKSKDFESFNSRIQARKFAIAALSGCVMA